MGALSLTPKEINPWGSGPGTPRNDSTSSGLRIMDIQEGSKEGGGWEALSSLWVGAVPSQLGD